MSEMRDVILSKITNRSAKVVVFGLGHVGLPKAAIIAEAGFQVIGVDPNSKIVEAISKGSISIKEPGLSDLIKQAAKKGMLRATSNGSTSVKEADIIFICVPTPIKEDKTPDLSYIQDVCKTITHNLSAGKLVIIESTLPPKTTKTFIAPMLEEGSGLRCGLDFWLAYCPERIAPGNAIQECVENVRIVGGYNSESVEIAVELFKAVIKGEVLTTDCTSAELAKLAENTFRDINIAFANELALICEQVGSDAIEVIKLANTHPRVSIHKPGCGVGGPCLPKDPYLLLYPVKEKGFESRVIEPSRELNDYMSKHAVELVVEGLTKAGKDVSKSIVAVLGVAYKGEVDETRNSPAERIVRELMDLGAEVVVYDPYCEESFGAGRAKDADEAVREADCIVIATDHKLFRELDLGRIKALMKENPALIDGRRVVNPSEANRQRFTYFGIGYGVECARMGS